jgi:hypothetical protein
MGSYDAIGRWIVSVAIGCIEASSGSAANGPGAAASDAALTDAARLAPAALPRYFRPAMFGRAFRTVGWFMTSLVDFNGRRIKLAATVREIGQAIPRSSEANETRTGSAHGQGAMTRSGFTPRYCAAWTLQDERGRLRLITAYRWG